MLVRRAIIAASLGTLPSACLFVDDVSEDHDFAFVVDDAFGPSQGAASAAAQLENAGVTLYDAVAIAEDLVDDGRAFQVSLDDGWLHVDVLGTLGVYGVWLAPDDGDIVNLVLEDDLGPPDHCPHVC